jgi:hypothetical protein
MPALGIPAELSGAFGLALAVSACGAPPPDDGSQGLVPGDCGGRGLRFSTPLRGESEAGTVSLEIERAEPARIQVLDNDWTLSLRDAAEGEITGASLQVRPWMVEHNHASLKACLVDELGGGRYRAAPIHLQMPGLWEVRVEIAAPDAPVDRVLFEFCVE